MVKDPAITGVESARVPVVGVGSVSGPIPPAPDHNLYLLTLYLLPADIEWTIDAWLDSPRANSTGETRSDRPRFSTNETSLMRQTTERHAQF
jgi:hypothetical protein